MDDKDDVAKQRRREYQTEGGTDATGAIGQRLMALLGWAVISSITLISNNMVKNASISVP